MKVQASPGTHVPDCPLSFWVGLWSPSKAHQRTGWPAEQPWYDVQVCLPFLAGSGGLIAVQA